MKILLAVNGTTSSYVAAQSVADGVWPEGSEVKLLFVIEPPMALASEVTAPPDDFNIRFEKPVRYYANTVIKHAAEQLRASKFQFRRGAADMVTGHAKFMILSEAEAWGGGFDSHRRAQSAGDETSLFRFNRSSSGSAALSSPM